MSFWKWMKETYLSRIRELKNSRLVALNFWMYFLGVFGSVVFFAVWVTFNIDGTFGRTWSYLLGSFGMFLLGNYGWYREYEKLHSLSEKAKDHE